MTKYLLDSNVVIEWLKGRAAAVALLDELNRRANVLAVNAITIAETYSGLSEDETRAAERVISAFDYWGIGPQVAGVAGSLRYRYAREGRVLSVPDVLLAAQALLEDATLITANVRDFPMPELRILPLPGA